MNKNVLVCEMDILIVLQSCKSIKILCIYCPSLYIWQSIFEEIKHN